MRAVLTIWTIPPSGALWAYGPCPPLSVWELPAVVPTPVQAGEDCAAGRHYAAGHEPGAGCCAFGCEGHRGELVTRSRLA